MRLSRIYLPIPLRAGDSIPLDDRARQYLTRVLRLRAGDRLVLFNGNGHEYPAVLVTSDSKSLTATIESCVNADRESTLKITLVQAVSRAERMDYAIQKAVELGVTAICPIIATRNVVQLSGARLSRRMEHWQQKIISACEQSQRNRLPDLGRPTPLVEFLSHKHSGALLLLDPQAQQSLKDIPTPDDEVTILVGPEGGLTLEEIAHVTSAGFTPVKLGPRTLRTETAGVAALAVMQARWGDL